KTAMEDHHERSPRVSSKSSYLFNGRGRSGPDLSLQIQDPYKFWILRDGRIAALMVRELALALGNTFLGGPFPERNLAFRAEVFHEFASRASAPIAENAEGREKSAQAAQYSAGKGAAAAQAFGTGGAAGAVGHQDDRHRY